MIAKTKTNRLSWLLCAILAVVLLAGIGGLLSGLVAPWLYAQYYAMTPYPEGAYVSGQPRLTFNGDARDIQEVQRKLAGFFKARGLTSADAADLRVSAGLHHRHGALFTFKLAPAQRQKLISGTKRLRTPAAAILAAGPVKEPRVRSVSPPDPAGRVARADLSYLRTLFPYNRLDWWPPPEADQQQMVVYKGPLDWHQPEAEPDTCYVFVNPGMDRVYVAADGRGT